MRRGLALLALLVVLSGCAGRWRKIHIFPACADGLPVLVLTDPRCPPDGICGYSCVPDRWHVPKKES